MRVWVLTLERDYEGSDVLGIFDSYTLAKMGASHHAEREYTRRHGPQIPPSVDAFRGALWSERRDVDGRSCIWMDSPERGEAYKLREWPVIDV